MPIRGLVSKLHHLVSVTFVGLVGLVAKSIVGGAPALLMAARGARGCHRGAMLGIPLRPPEPDERSAPCIPLLAPGFASEAVIVLAHELFEVRE